jgi:hypothetical protein
MEHLARPLFHSLTKRARRCLSFERRPYENAQKEYADDHDAEEHRAATYEREPKPSEQRRANRHDAYDGQNHQNHFAVHDALLRYWQRPWYHFARHGGRTVFATSRRPPPSQKGIVGPPSPATIKIGTQKYAFFSLVGSFSGSKKTGRNFRISLPAQTQGFFSAGEKMCRKNYLLSQILCLFKPRF